MILLITATLLLAVACIALAVAVCALRYRLTATEAEAAYFQEKLFQLENEEQTRRAHTSGQAIPLTSSSLSGDVDMRLEFLP